MKLPNRKQAYVPQAKLANYLLSEIHVVGRWKAKFLINLGFDESNISLLQKALLIIAQKEEVKDTISSSHGTKFIIDGSLQSPIGKTVDIRTIWIIDKDQKKPRFVTAYPI